MATDFFERQSDAHKSTTWLIWVFCLAVFSIVTTVFVVALAVMLQGMHLPVAAIGEDPSLLVIPSIASGITLLLIVGGTLYKVFELSRGGGTLVAERLGGKRLLPYSEVPVERRLLNIVEEMALASGTPVPPVFLLDEEGINAFAAGYSPSDAVLGVTQGCASQLTREELQGVIAHEFSHILNGDMRMSIRLMGVLHGILLLGLAGQAVLRMLAYSSRGRSRSRGKGHAQMLLVMVCIGLGLIVLGFIGTFIGNLIKAAVSRQREYLADASAVQFTRNPDGLAGALKKIGARAKGSQLKAAVAAEASHMFFAKGVFEGFSGLWATHPPLDERIRAVDPSWDGEFPEAGIAEMELDGASLSSDAAAGFVGGEQRSGRQSMAATEITDEEVPRDIVEHVREPSQAHQHYAVRLVAELPKEVLLASRDPYGARAVLFSLLLDRREDIRSSQLQVLDAMAQKDIVGLTRALAPVVDQLDVRARLPLVDLALPALRAMCKSQYEEFEACFDALVKADPKMELFEWMLSQVLVRHLRPQFEPVRSPPIDYYALQQLGEPCSTLLSAIAYAGNPDDEAERAFRAAAAHLPEVSLSMRSRQDSGLGQLREVLDLLATVSAKHRGRLVDACAAAVCADERVQWQEAELLRGVADLLDCPMPPLLVASTNTTPDPDSSSQDEPGEKRVDAAEVALSSAN